MSTLSLRSVPRQDLRWRAHMENALAVDQFLESRALVCSVLYPKLPSHPQHAIHKNRRRECPEWFPST
ncbi:hypothetical protein L596_005512 [Steinernema carpocapsae]|uniref:Uncharacterized protein n=1 Tax=Steinernema carpocapsae TaxID=34508 RepID=A0A4U8V0P9_STECR|nr:hypothetical protein L596_005512 [Steinernema carpocapsae]